jgi:hypothetical protein
VVLASVSVGDTLREPIIAAHHSRNSRALFIGDHSFFVNEMLLHGDNAQFARNCIDWLRQSNSRTKLVIVADGQPQSPLGLTGALPPIDLDRVLDAALQHLPSIAPRIDDRSMRVFVNNLLTSLEDKDAFNEAVADRPRGTHTAIIRRLTVVLAAIVLAALFIARLITGYERVAPEKPRRLRFWRNSPRRTRPTDYSHWLSVLSRELFERYLPVEKNAFELHRVDGRPPRVISSHEPFWRRAWLTRRVSWFWHSAYSPSRKQISQRRFRKYLGRLRALEQDLLAERWRLDR